MRTTYNSIKVSATLTLPHRLDIIHAYKARGGSIAAVFPIHFPRALLRAFDILAVDVWGPPKVDASHGATHLQPYVCSVARNALAFLQSGGLDIADILIVPHTCDSLQGVGSVLIDFISPRQPVIPLYLPRGKRPSDINFLADELRSVFARLQSITNRQPSEAELLECNQREELADERLAQLHQRRTALPFTDFDFYRLIRSREYLPAETFVELAEGSLAQAADIKSGGIPVVLSGIVPEPMTVLEAISELGGVIVADDFACCGRRLYPRGTSDDPFRRMAERIVYAPPDSTRGNSIQERLDHLLGLVRSNEAKGVIFYEVKFCEPELFDLPNLRKGLQEANIPSLVVEVDINDPLSHQVRTRLEAFLEIL